MNVSDVIPMLAQAEAEGNPVLGFVIMGGILVWLLAVIFGGKKDKYVVTHGTSVRKVKS